MDKKKLIRSLDQEDMKGFEEFIESQPNDTNFLPRGLGGSPNKKNDTSFEHLNFLTNDSERLLRIKNLLTQKLPFSSKFEQSAKLIDEQRAELQIIRQRLYEVCDQADSRYQKSLGEIFDGFFAAPKS
ncbi:MAG TPA: hypothetical protein VNJ01_03145 [Bacteriovoracaceae bacterium]|nr:hypothetical protein [Bacteriovoracaceae bacterium]